MTYLAVAILLAFFGLILLVGEYFFATMGVLLVGAIMCFFAAVAIIGIYGSTLELAVASVLGMVGIPLSTYGAVMVWKKVFGGEPSQAAEATINDMPELAGLETLRGRVGKTISQMRPSGVVDFEGQRIDAISEGPMFDAGVWVKCVDVKAGKVIIRQVEGPTDSVKNSSHSTSPHSPPVMPAERKKADLNADDWTIT